MNGMMGKGALAAGRIGLMAALAATMVSPAKADGMPTRDSRVWVAAEGYPWSAIGRLSRGDGHVCSGSLVAPAVVLTAAHCLWRDGAPVPAAALTFQAGAEEGRHVGLSPAVSYAMAPGYGGPGDRSLANSARDWALVRLAAPIGERAGTLGLLPLDDAAAARLAARRAVVIQAGYPLDRPFRQSAHIGCRVTGWAAAGLLAHDCAATGGASGAPLLVWERGDTPGSGGFRIVAIHVSRYQRQPGAPVRGAAVPGASIVPAASRAGARPLGDIAAADPPAREVWGVLDLLGFDPGGRGLEAAVRAFQDVAGLPPTGRPEPAVLGHALEAAAHRK